MTEFKVLKAIVLLKNKRGQTDPLELARFFGTDDLSLLPYLRSLNTKRLISQDLTYIYVTDKGISLCS